MKKLQVIVPVIALFCLIPLIVGSTLKEEQEPESFNEEDLYYKLDEMNFSFPHIVYAQAILETGNFTSDNFKENNNLFGMRRAKSRITSAKLEAGPYAKYNSWEDSLIDYGFFQSRYLGKIKSEQEYYSYLEKNYASDPDYIFKLKDIVNKRKLKRKFSDQ